MTREQAKELLPIIQAFAEGEIIQYKNFLDEWEDIKENEGLSFICPPSDYRIKPKPETKYRPFETKEECWNEMLKHQPFGWIKHKETEDYSNILGICKISGITKILMSGCSCEFLELFDEFVFIDGTPFGIKEE